jgi:hypothetical protein
MGYTDKETEWLIAIKLLGEYESKQKIIFLLLDLTILNSISFYHPA